MATNSSGGASSGPPPPSIEQLAEDAVVWASQHGLVRGYTYCRKVQRGAVVLTVNSTVCRPRVQIAQAWEWHRCGASIEERCCEILADQAPPKH